MDYKVNINGIISEGDEIWLSDFILDNLEDLKVNESIEISITKKAE